MENRNYKNGKIYCIRNNFDNDIYVGHTTQTLSKRMEKHRRDCKTSKSQSRKLYLKMRELGIENFYIELLEKYPCNDIEELRAKEGEWIRKMGTVNMLLAGRTPEQYRKDTVEQKKEYDKEYVVKYRGRRKELNQTLYENKQEELKQKAREYSKQRIICECGMEVCRGALKKHLQRKHHQNYLNNNIENV